MHQKEKKNPNNGNAPAIEEHNYCQFHPRQPAAERELKQKMDLFNILALLPSMETTPNRKYPTDSRHNQQSDGMKTKDQTLCVTIFNVPFWRNA